MKTSNKPILVLFTLFALALTACGKKNGGDVPPPVGGGVPVYPNGQYPGGVGGALTSQCVPINGAIPFGGSMMIDSAGVYAGSNMPVNNSYNPYQNPYGTGAISMTGTGSDGSIMIQAQGVGGNIFNGSGQLQLSQLFIQTLMYKLQYSGMYGQQIPCAVVQSINLSHYNTRLYGGQVQILINGQIPLAVYF